MKKKTIIKQIDNLINSNFEGWTEESKNGYLTACDTIKDIISANEPQNKKEIIENSVSDGLLQTINNLNKTTMKNSNKIATAIKDYLVQLAIDDKLSSDINELSVGELEAVINTITDEQYNI